MISTMSASPATPEVSSLRPPRERVAQWAHALVETLPLRQVAQVTAELQFAMPSLAALKRLPAVHVSLLLHAIGFLFIAFIAIASAFGWSDLYRWTADPVKLTTTQPYDGLLSNLGVVAWASAAAICLFTALTWWNTADRQLSQLVLGGGVVTSVLLCDDLFMGHDELFPRLFGVTELVATIVLALVPLGYLWFFRRVIHRASWALLAIGVIYLAIMTGIDAVEHRMALPGHHLWEEGSKFLGLLHWCGYLIQLSWLLARRATG